MPKFTKIQTTFTTGEISASVYGRVDIQERYDAGLVTCLNYMPIIQGPLLRRPGTKYVANVKDSTKPGVLYPFQISATQGYALEFGDNYIRFFTNDGQAVANTNVFKISSYYSYQSGTGALLNFHALRSTTSPQNGEIQFPVGFSTSVISAGQALELYSPYSYQDVANLRIVQNANTAYIVHPAYPPYKLQRLGANLWDLKPLYLQDGPYLPFNSYATRGDSATINLTPNNAITGFLSTGSSFQILSASNDGTGRILLGLSATPQFSAGDKVYVSGVTSSSAVNNNTSSIQASFWSVATVSGSTVALANSTFNGAVTNSSGTIAPALFMLNSSGIGWADLYPDTFGPNNNSLVTKTFGGRIFSLSNNGVRYWGMLQDIVNPSQAQFNMIGGALPNTNPASVWQLGVYNNSLGYPTCVNIHQNRLYFAGSPGMPQEMDGSTTGNYENFAASGSSYNVTDTNAIQFSLASQDIQPIFWMKSTAQGMLAGSLSGEWQISPSTANAGLTPTNFTAQQIAAFGSANIDAVNVGNSALYIQKAQRKIRELNYFFQAGTFRSTNLSDLSEHLTLPSITKLAVQKEIHPCIWALRSDGQLLSLTYSRDDFSIKAGWARHQLGGQSDSSGTPAAVKSMTVITASSGFYDELWTTVQRSIAGSNVVTVEYMSRPFDFTSLQEDSYYFDCGATLDTPIQVTGITNASSCVITAPSHGLTNSSVVRFYSCVGVNTTVTDINGIVTQSSLVNFQKFMVASTSTNSFKIQDFAGNDINSTAYSPYLGSSFVRKMNSLVTGATWLIGETVSVLGDGGVLSNTTVSNVGSVGLSGKAGKVHIGYDYNSDAQLLRTKDGSAQGTSIGSSRRVNRVAFMLNNVGVLYYGPSFTSLSPIEFSTADANLYDTPVPLFQGIYRNVIASGTDQFTDTVCFRQNAGLPGTINAIVRFVEEQDV